MKYFVFTELPFERSSAPFIFTKMVRPLDKFWRSLAIKITCFLDDDLCIKFDVNLTNKDSQIVKETLLNILNILNI